MNTYSKETIEWVAKRLSESVEATALILLTHDHPKHEEAQKILSEDIKECIQRIQSWDDRRQPYGALLELVARLPKITPPPAPNRDSASYTSREKRAEEFNARTKNSAAQKRSILKYIIEDRTWKFYGLGECTPQTCPEKIDSEKILLLENSLQLLRQTAQSLEFALAQIAEPPCASRQIHHHHCLRCDKMKSEFQSHCPSDMSPSL